MKSIYDKLMDMGGIDMNSSFDVNARRKKYESVSGRELFVSFIFGLITSFLAVIIRYFLITITIVKTLQWLGVI